MTLDRCTIALERMARLIQTAQVWQFTKGIPSLRRSATAPSAGCPTDRAFCDVCVLAPTGMLRDHNQTRRKNHGSSVEEILPNPQVKWRIQRPHIRKERECVGRPADLLLDF